MFSDLLYNFFIFVLLQGFAYVPRDDLVSLVANEFRMQLSRALAVSFFSLYIIILMGFLFHCVIQLNLRLDHLSSANSFPKY